MSLESKIHAEAKRRYGKRPDQLTATQFQVCSVVSMGRGQRVTAAVSAAGSVIRTTAGQVIPPKIVRLNVLPDVEAARERICRGQDPAKGPCSAFLQLADGAPACTDCGCAGRIMLRSAWKNPRKVCRRKRWPE